MRVELSKNGVLEIRLIPTDAIDAAFVQEFKRASHGSNPPKVKVEDVASRGSGGECPVLIVWQERMGEQA